MEGRRDDGDATGMPRIAAILAGGRGSRLGGVSKESIPVDGEALGPRLARILSGHFENIIVVTNNPEMYAGTRARTTADLIPGYGPLSGLHAALSLAREGGKGELVWLAACDMPAFDLRLVELLAEGYAAALEKARREGSPGPLACLARFGRHFEPFQAIYSTHLVGELESLFEAAATAATMAASVAAKTQEGAGDRGIRRPSFKELFARAPAAFVAEEEVRRITPNWALYFNVNTPAELARLGGSDGS
ncbi:MAG TPA: molybdenum cofactor guanylyltransferase [Rectinemataceae bacterium]|nr:molybdenum cofactor guanylyltransferase [Rectinemataceae bacterium]